MLILIIIMMDFFFYFYFKDMILLSVFFFGLDGDMRCMKDLERYEGLRKEIVDNGM